MHTIFLHLFLLLLIIIIIIIIFIVIIIVIVVIVVVTNIVSGDTFFDIRKSENPTRLYGKSLSIS